MNIGLANLLEYNKEKRGYKLYFFMYFTTKYAPK